MYKHGAFPEGAAIPDLAERGSITELRSSPWLADTSVDYRSWGYIKDAEYKSAESIVWHMIDVVSKNGVFLLNIGPRCDGVIPEEQRRILSDIGGWLRIYGEAVYGVGTWRVYGEGPSRLARGGFFTERSIGFMEGDVRYTMRDAYPTGRMIYAVTSTGSKTINLRSLARNLRLIDEDEEIIDVELIGSREKPVWSYGDEGLRIEISTPSLEGIIASRILVRRSRDTR